ncbi:MAG: iron complex outermembrane receptor protein [Polaribacter sp.]|jgi:iron complex outermembrane receptor protein
MKNITFKKQRLAATISMLLGTSVIAPIYAQESEQEGPQTAVNTDAEAIENDEEAEGQVVFVTGIRGSLIRSMDMKRDAIGVMDAISAEEMGKFPDANLAESLQRITGVTVSRTNGEGSEITVRGFGPDFNLVTLNGRQMPGTGNTRSFKLENLSSEGVSALEVFKTSRAENPSGGLGATVNIVTTKPLASPGLKYSVSAKGIVDTSNVAGDDITPEIAGVYSNTFVDDTFGVAISLSSQRRDFQQQSANVPGWQADQGLGDATGDDAIDNRPVDVNGDPIGHTYFPRQISYNLNDVQRVRDNGQLTLQWAPADNMVATLDYTASRAETATSGRGFGVWFNFGGNINSYELDENGTAIRFSEANNDYAHSANKETLLVESESIGLNFEWQATDDLHFEFDYHDSESTTDNGADDGSHHSGNVIISPNNIVIKEYDYSTGEIPNFIMTWPNGAAEASPGDFDPLFAQFGRAEGKSTVEQFRLNGVWENPGNSFFINTKFGIASTTQTFGGYAANNGNQGPNGYNGNQGIFPDSMFTRQNTGNLLDQFDGGGSALTTNYYYTFDYDEAVARMAAFFSPFETEITGLRELLGITEETQSAYMQGSFVFDISGIQLDVTAGFRYEQTDVVSEVRQKVEDIMVWSNPTEWQLRFTDSTSGLLVTEGEHDLFLPSIDIKAEVYEDVMVRASAGKTVSRAPLGALAGARSLSPSPKPGSRTGGSGNTNLQPFESTNIDLSVEYYYGEGSFVSLGFFKKDVDNFIQTSLSTITVDGIRDPFNGPRATAARAALAARGEQETVTAVWNEIIAMGGGIDDDCCETQVIVQNDDDPLTEWLVSQPGNGDSKSVKGLEFSVQHLFGDSGFGGAFNATLVDGDVEYDVNNFGGIQSPLVGLSDSANLQSFYEKDGLSVKVTYAWRDEYLIGVGQAQGSADNPPQFGEEFGQWDLSVNYDVSDELTVFFEGINLNNETERTFGRYKEQFLSARQYGSRYTLGARYTF